MRGRFLILIWNLPVNWFEELCRDRSAAEIVTSDDRTGFLSAALSPRVIISGKFVKSRWLIQLSDYPFGCQTAPRTDLWADKDEKDVTGCERRLEET